MLLPLLLAAVTITADFEGGSIGACRTIGESHMQCDVEGESDQDGRNRQASWYYFRADAPAGQPLTIDLTALAGEYNYQPNKGSISDQTPPVVSYDRQTWNHLTTVDYEAGEPRLRLRLTPERSPVWIAHVAPYTNADLERLLDEIGTSPYLSRETIGQTVEGRDLLLLTVADRAVPLSHMKVVWLMIRQHSWESGSSWVGEGALRYLLSDDPTARAIRRGIVFKILPLCDPDGVARGGVRFNNNGYDLNRNWDTPDSGKMPEIAAQRSAVLEWLDGGHSVDLFLTLHNTETAEYLEGPPAGHDGLMNRLFGLLERDTTFSPSHPARHAPPTTTAGKPGRMTVYQGLHHDRGIPAFLMEQRIAHNPKLGGYPTVEDRLAFGPQLIKAISGALTAPIP